MPIYEYRCKKGHTFEVRQSFSDENVTTCEVCGAVVERVYHPIAVHFKGSGFYNTDYGTRQRSREMKEAKEAKEAKSKSESASKSDSSSADSSSGGSDSSSGSDKSSSTGSGASKTSDSTSSTTSTKKADAPAKSK